MSDTVNPQNDRESTKNISNMGSHLSSSGHPANPL